MGTVINQQHVRRVLGTVSGGVSYGSLGRRSLNATEMTTPTMTPTTRAVLTALPVERSMAAARPPETPPATPPEVPHIKVNHSFLFKDIEHSSFESLSGNRWLRTSVGLSGCAESLIILAHIL